MNTAASARHLAIDALDRAIVNLAGLINAATYELLVLVREFDERAVGVARGQGSLRPSHRNHPAPDL